MASDPFVTEREWAEAWKFGPRAIVYLLVLVGLLVGGVHLIRTQLLPAQERLRRDVYEESKSYRDGTVRDLENLRLEWVRTEDDLHRSMLEDAARRRTVDFPREELPAALQEWLQEITP